MSTRKSRTARSKVVRDVSREFLEALKQVGASSEVIEAVRAEKSAKRGRRRRVGAS